MAAAAQVSIYPLRQEHLGPAIDVALAAFRQHGLEVTPGSMSTMLVGEDSDLFAALKQAYQAAGAMGPVVMNVTLSNACPVPGQ